MATRLRKGLEGVVFDLLGASPRPSALVHKAGVNKSMATRLIQVLRTQDPLTALKQTPAPTGLRIFLRAAEKAGAGRASIARAEEVVGEFEAIISQFPSGRAGLDGALSGWLPEARDQGERVARQGVFKGMSFLLGHQVDVSAWAVILQPSADGQHLDVAHVRGKYGLRRLRHGEPLGIFSARTFPLDPDQPFTTHTRPIRGTLNDPKSFLLEEFCSQNCPPLEIVETNDEQQFILQADQPPVNTPVTIVLAELVPHGWHRYASPSLSEEWLSLLPRIPTKTTICDIFLRDDVYPGVEPSIDKALVGVNGKPNPTSRSTSGLDNVDVAVETSWLPNGTADIGTGEIPRYEEMMTGVFGSLGWDAQRFRVHRLKMNYPPPGIAITRWFALPQRP